MLDKLAIARWALTEAYTRFSLIVWISKCLKKEPTLISSYRFYNLMDFVNAEFQDEEENEDVNSTQILQTSHTVDYYFQHLPLVV